MTPLRRIDQRNRLALPGLHIGQQRGDVMEGVTIDGLDGVAGAQAGLLRRHARLHLVHQDRSGNVLRQRTRIADIEILVL